MRFIYIFLLIFSFAQKGYTFNIYYSTGINRVEFQSGYARYDDNTHFILLSTDVVVYHLSDENKIIRTIKTQDMSINLSSSIINMNSPFVLYDSSASIIANSGKYNYQDYYGEIDNGMVYMNKFIFRGKKIEISKDKYIYKNASVTTCDLDKPHYHISASRIYLIPGKHFFAYNTLFYLGKVPIFYFPVIYKPLGEGTPVISQFYPGYDERNGFYIKSNYIYKFDRYTKLKLFLDFFSKKGLGTGTEFDYFKPDINKTSFSFYRIREYGDKTDRWGINGGSWLSLNKLNFSGAKDLYFQGYFRLISDPSFNNNFFRSNPFAVSSDKQAGASLTYKTMSTLTRISSYVNYTSTKNYEGFEKSYEAAPKIEFQTNPIKFKKIPFFNTYSISLENSMDNTPYYQKKGNASWNISQPVSIYKNISFYPDFFYNQNIFFSTSSNNRDIFIGRYGADINLRYSFKNSDLDLKYYTLIRNKANTTKRDTEAIDKGIEERYLFSSLFFIRNSSNYFRIYTKYDLKDYVFSKDFIERFYPINFEFYRKINDFEFYLQESYSLTQGNKYIMLQLNTGNNKNYFNMGIANYSNNKHKYILSNSMGFIPPILKSWQAEFKMNYSIDFSGKPVDFNFFDKELILYKDFHDFRTKFNMRVRKGVKEFFVYITLKMNDRYRRDEIDRQADSFWHPWRKEGEFRDY